MIDETPIVSVKQKGMMRSSFTVSNEEKGQCTFFFTGFNWADELALYFSKKAIKKWIPNQN